MSIISGGSNYFSQINSQIAAKGPSDQQAATAKASSGGQAQEAKHHGKGDSDGVSLSKLAQKHTSEVDHHKQFIEEHADEEMQSLGLAQEQETSEDGEVSERKTRNRERNLGMDDTESTNMRRVVSSEGAEQFLDDEQAQRLQVVDGEDYGFDMNGDIPEANMKAAEQIFQTQASQGLKKVAELKAVPEAQEAGRIETEIVGYECEPMDIMDPTSSKYQPMSLELPESVHEIAREMAAKQLADGTLDEQMLAL